MRPRVFPAEDIRPSPNDDMLTVASMRPRVFPAEDAEETWGRLTAAISLQ